MTITQITNLQKLLQQIKSSEYRIIDSRTEGKKLYSFHQWANAKYYHGAFLISNNNNERYWFLLIEWKPKISYLVLYPEIPLVPLVEMHKVEINEGGDMLTWTYIPRKRDGRNQERLSNFTKYYSDVCARITLPKTKQDITDFLDEVFWLLKIKFKSESLDETEPEGEYIFPEGKKIQRLHTTRERNRKVVDVAKRQFRIKNKGLFCEVCKFDFEKKYGEVGKGFIEAHHILPLSLANEQEIATQPKDLVMVCSNCHKMIHRRRPWLTKDTLTALVVY